MGRFSPSELFEAAPAAASSSAAGDDPRAPRCWCCGGRPARFSAALGHAAPGRAPVEVMGGAVTDLRQEVELLDRGFRDECARAREEADARPMET